MASQALTDIRGKLQRLLRLPAGKHWIVSCYLKIEPRDRSRGKYLIKLKNRIREVVEALRAEGLDRAQTEQVVADLQKLLTTLQNPDALPATRGLAAFVCKPLGLFEIIPLPRVYRSRLLVDRSALVRELVALEDEVGRLLAAVLDKTGAAIYEVTAFDTKKLADIEAEPRRAGKYQAGMGGEHHFHNRLRHEREQLLDAVAAQLFAIDRREPVRGIVLTSAGTEADALRMFLHPYVAGKVMGTARLGRKGASLAQVHSAVLDVREEFERKLERHLVAEMLLGQGSGWSVNGIAPTLDALSKGQVRTLLVRADASVPGFHCAATGRLTLNAKDCRGLGNAVPAPDVIDDAIEEALRQRVDLDVVFEPDAADTINGLAALLRFR
jgi:peptide chain release factor subunit 1